jgi:hypothetical protein
MIFTTNSFCRTRGGHRGLNAHRMSEKPLAREVMRCEESEQVGGHGVEGVWGGAVAGECPWLRTISVGTGRARSCARMLQRVKHS